MKNADNIDISLYDFLLLRRDRLIDKLRLLDEQIRDEQASLTFQKYGVKVGSIVRSGGKLYRVTKVDSHRFPRAPWLVGNPQRKDGTYGNAARNLFTDWELVAEIEVQIGEN